MSRLIKSCIVLLYISALAPAVTYGQGVSLDDLYANRADLSSARRAALGWKAALDRDPNAFDAAWKLARADYWLGGHAPERERRGFLEQGIDAAQKAAALESKRPEGHFWIAANMGALAESYGLRAGLKYRKPIKDQLETVLAIDPGFQSGSADRALGRWYFKVPRLFGGSTARAEEHLRASLVYDPHSTVTHYFLAELLVDEHRTDEARAELHLVLDAPPNQEWAPEDHDYKERARALLATLK
jgi:tetratricopeptide (TPR) repeat protein